VNDIRERFLPEATKVLAQRDLKRPAFFFIETSCSGNVNARQACAVESAAKLHPEADVYLLLLSPPSFFNISSNAVLRTLTEHYSNTRVLYVHLFNYFRGSPLEDWYRSGILRASQYQQSHTSDAFRYFTLWKYGGTYLDLDIVLVRSLKHLKNFAGAESSEDIAAGVMNFEPPKSYLAFQCLKDIRDNFRGDDWGSNGPGVITRMLKRVCNTQDATKMTRKKCSGFAVLPPSAFYPISWKKWKLYFDESASNSTMIRLSHSYGIHVWNKFSSTENVTVGSRQPYGLVAQKFCPRVYSTSQLVF
jgi:lactosylceramide 4-alpha-galactosyltransferase